jgi:hypothetical protein
LDGPNFHGNSDLHDEFRQVAVVVLDGQCSSGSAKASGASAVQARTARRTAELISAMISFILDEPSTAPADTEVNVYSVEFVYEGKACRTSVQYIASEDKFQVMYEVLTHAQTYWSQAEYDWKELESYDNATDAIAEAISVSNHEYEAPED